MADVLSDVDLNGVAIVTGVLLFILSPFISELFIRIHRTFAMIVLVVVLLSGFGSLLFVFYIESNRDSFEGANKTTSPPIVFPGEYVELRVPSGRVSARGIWRGSNAKFIPYFVGEPAQQPSHEEVDSSVLPILRGLTSRTTWPEIMVASGWGNEDLMVWISVRLPDDDRLCNRRIWGHLDVDAWFPLQVDREHYINQFEHFSIPLSFFVTCGTWAIAVHLRKLETGSLLFLTFGLFLLAFFSYARVRKSDCLTRM